MNFQIEYAYVNAAGFTVLVEIVSVLNDFTCPVFMSLNTLTVIIVMS